MGFMSKLLRQCRRPSGWLGRMVARGMNKSHSDLTDWGLSYISIGKADTILDVGCGGGGTVRKLARVLEEGRVYGIDYSEESVSISTRTNWKLVQEGRVTIQHGSVSSLPFPNRTFDLVTAIESHYFWPDLVNDMKEVMRVLKPGGTLIMIGGAYKGGKYDERNKQWVVAAKMTYLTVGEFGELFRVAGYTGAQVYEDYDRGRICGVGRKPQPSREHDQDEAVTMRRVE